jgi:hypothetical protein
MKLVTHSLDIKALKACQAWENYCNALHLALAYRKGKKAEEFRGIARQSLDQHFAEVERRMIRANERGSV